MPSKKTKDHTRFYLKTPNEQEKRASFSIMVDQILETGRKQYGLKALIKLDKGLCEYFADAQQRIDAINRELKSSKNLEKCKVLAQEVINSLYKEHHKRQPINVHLSENLQILDDYYLDRYANSNIKRPGMARTDLLRAVNVLGPLSLHSATVEEMQRQIDVNVKDADAQRRVIGRIHALLKHIGRQGVRLRKKRRTRKPVKYISEQELGLLLNRLSDDKMLQALIAVCFYTGCRPGEAFALTADKLIDGRYVDVFEQLDYDSNLDDPKSTNSVRKAYLVSEGRVAFDTWVGISDVEKARLQKARVNGELSKLIRTTCQALWPDQSIKHLTTKDFRHCYAKMLLANNLSIGTIAQLLGNTEQVCRDHYLGNSASKELLVAVDLLITSNRSSAKNNP
jgi:integrase